MLYFCGHVWVSLPQSKCDVVVGGSVLVVVVSEVTGTGMIFSYSRVIANDGWKFFKNFRAEIVSGATDTR